MYLVGRTVMYSDFNDKVDVKCRLRFAEPRFVVNPYNIVVKTRFHTNTVDITE